MNFLGQYPDKDSCFRMDAFFPIVKRDKEKNETLKFVRRGKQCQTKVIRRKYCLVECSP